jgi:ubiquinone/menaquinone biosynthesis C-methylase UbiE
MDFKSKATSEWYTTFFKGLFVQFWSEVIPPRLTDNEVRFLKQHLPVRPGAHILDVPCGNGRHAVALAKAGASVTAVDISADFLELAVQAAQAANVNVRFVQADMAKLPALGAFDGAYCLGNSFSYLQPANTRGFVQHLARLLKPGATLVLETGVTAESVLPGFTQGTSTSKMGAYTTQMTRAYDAYEGRLDVSMTLTKAGVTETAAYCYYMFTAREVRNMLEAAGFTDVQFYTATERLSGPANVGFEPGSPDLYIVCRRP